jgi:chemotaxis protein MotB
MKPRKTTHVNHERWLVSYADFITLLFAFFVVLYSSAQVDKRKVGQLAVAIQAAFQDLGAFAPAGAATPSTSTVPSAVPRNSPALPQAPPFNEMKVLQEQLKQTLAVEIGKKEVSIHMSPEGLVLSLREVGFFDSGSAAMRPQGLAAFSRVVKILQEEPHRLRIEGHTDNIPIHTRRFASNWELSTARATEVVRLLIMRYDFSPDRLSAAGYGEFHPVADNATLDGRQSNRRVDVVVLSENRK